MPDRMVPIFINGSPLSVRADTTLAAALGEHLPELMAGMMTGEVRATDGRGIAVDPEAMVHAGAIYRVFKSARRSESGDA